MEAKNPMPKIVPPKAKEKRPYGKAPLELDLPQALETVNRIAQEGRAMGESQLAAILGNTVTSSAFPRKIRSLVSYGLLVDQQPNQYALTELALSIAFPRSPEAEMEGKKIAFLKIEQFNFLFNQHKGKLLPADEFLRNIVEQEFAIPRDVSEAWVRQFKEGARACGLFFLRSDGKTQISESPMVRETQAPEDPVVAPAFTAPAIASVKPTESLESTVATQPKLPISSGYAPVTSGHSTRIELSDGRRAEFLIPDKLTSRDAEKLKKALQGIAVIIESMISEAGG
jgi:hypothetical protein